MKSPYIICLRIALVSENEMWFSMLMTLVVKRRNVRTGMIEMLTDHTKRSCVLEDVLIKMSLHSSFPPVSYETSWN